jgi:hypothetical protein
MTPHLTEEDLVLLYYKEPSIPAFLSEHLTVCPKCRDSARSLAATLDKCNEWAVPEPAPGLEDRIKSNLPAPVIAIRAWLYTAAAVAAVLLLAFMAGRYSKRPQPSVFAGLSAQAQHRILEISLADHLERADLLLTEIAHAPDNDPVDLARAQDLVQEGRLIRQTLARDGDSATLELVDQVERTMLDLANSPSPSELRQLRESIASNSLLFKLRIIESNLRTQGQNS